jgi:hypothetical protein
MTLNALPLLNNAGKEDLAAISYYLCVRIPSFPSVSVSIEAAQLVGRARIYD